MIRQSNSKNQKSLFEMAEGVANGTRTRNSQNHNLELYH